MQRSNFKSVDEYISTFPAPIQNKLKEMRRAVKSAAPEAGEKISYQIPTYTLHGNLVHFAGYEHHIGFYPGAVGVEEFKKEIKGYKFSKGTIQFPLEEPLPLDLVKRIVKFRVKQNSESAKK